MSYTPESFVLLAVALFCIGLVAVVTRRNLFVVYLAIELMLNAVGLLLALFSTLRPEMGGAVVSLLLIGVIAAEAAVFLAMIVHLARLRKSLDSDDYTELAQRRFS